MENPGVLLELQFPWLIYSCESMLHRISPSKHFASKLFHPFYFIYHTDNLLKIPIKGAKQWPIVQVTRWTKWLESQWRLAASVRLVFLGNLRDMCKSSTYRIGDQINLALSHKLRAMEFSLVLDSLAINHRKEVSAIVDYIVFHLLFLYFITNLSCHLHYQQTRRRLSSIKCLQSRTIDCI